MPKEYEYSSTAIVASNIKRLMRKKGVIASDVCRALGIPNATFSDWTNGKTYPRIKQLEKLAAYFNVNKSDIIDIPIDKDPIYDAAKAETIKKQLDEDAELLAYLDMLRTRPECRILLDTIKGATKEEVEANVRFIEALRREGK